MFKNLKVKSFVGESGLEFLVNCFGNLKRGLIPMKSFLIPKKFDRFRKVYVYDYAMQFAAEEFVDSLTEFELRQLVSKHSYGILQNTMNQAVRRVLRFYKDNLAMDLHVLTGDFENFSDSISKKKMHEVVEEVEFWSLQDKIFVNSLINQSQLAGGTWETDLKGVHSGLKLVSLLLNRYLYSFDRQIADLSRMFVRVGDNFICFGSIQEIERVRSFLDGFQNEHVLKINYTSNNIQSPFEYLSYVIDNGVIAVRESSVARFRKRVCDCLQPRNLKFDDKLSLLKYRYKREAGLGDLMVDFLLAYPFLNSRSQIVELNEFMYRRLNYFLFGFKGLSNFDQLRLALNKINFKSILFVYTGLENGALEYNKKSLEKIYK